MVDVQNTLVNNALLRWGTEDQKTRYFPRLATKWWAPTRSPRRTTGSDAFALSCRAVDKGVSLRADRRKL